jgi:glycosyltransferase involved in cell wall biosynthesis
MVKNKRKMKYNVLLIGPKPPPAGGIATFCKTLMENITEPNVFIEHHNLGRIDRDETILKKIFSRMQIYARFVRLLFKLSPDIIHINTASYNNFYFNSGLVILSKIAFKKTILHIHGGGFKDFYSNISLIKRLLIKIILQISNKIITLSEKWKIFFNEIIKADKIEIIPNAIDVEKFKNKKINDEDKERVITVSFLGNINKAKGILDIFKAIPLVINKYGDCIFNFAGIISSEIDNECKKIESYSNVRFFGEIFGESKKKFLNSADIFILPSYTEGLPIAMLEAMASKLPIISTTVGAIPEIIQDNKNGYLITPGDYENLAEKIIILAKDQNLRKRMGANNLRKMHQEYDMNNINKKLLKIYKNLLSS